jgi:FG-GAP-like repeat
MRQGLFLLALASACSPSPAAPRAPNGTPGDAGGLPAEASGPLPEAGVRVDAAAGGPNDASAAWQSDAAASLPYANPPARARCAGRWSAPIDGPAPSFDRLALLALPGAGYLLPHDVDGDGYPELLVSTLTERVDFGAPGGGPPLSAGGAYVLARTPGAAVGTVPSFTRSTAFDVSAGILWPNASSVFDVDGDALEDWVIGAGFLTKPVGSLVWLKKTASGYGPPARIPVPDPSCFYHEALPTDFDADGDLDFVTTCHVGSTANLNGPSRLEWFENPGDGSADYVHHALGEGGGALLTLFDVDGDGDDDVIAPQFFEGAALAWYEHTSDGALTAHVIDDAAGRGFVTRLGDVNGDGRTDLVFGNHNNEVASAADERTMGIYWYEFPRSDALAGLRDWSAYKHVVYEGFEVSGDGNGVSAGAPGMLHLADLDGDCDLDITASGDGDLGLYAFIQGTAGFTQVVLDRGPGNVNSGEQHAFDIDLDGDTDIVWAVFGPNDPLAALTSGLSSAVIAFVQR